MPSTFLFAYGSLLFRPIPFPGIVSRVGFVNSLRRRFAQFSHDHRGTPSCPGVVVTLVTAHDWALHSEGDDEFEEMPIWGRIYEIPEEGARAVWDYLDHREKDGYTLEKVDVFDRVGTEELLIQKDVSPSSASSNPTLTIMAVLCVCWPSIKSLVRRGYPSSPARGTDSHLGRPLRPQQGTSLLFYTLYKMLIRASRSICTISPPQSDF